MASTDLASETLTMFPSAIESTCAKKIWYHWRILKSRPDPYEESALPLSYSGIW